jgi:hypothetical protein
MFSFLAVKSKIKSVYQKYLPRYVSFLQALIKFNKHHYTLTTKVFMSLYRNFMTTFFNKYKKFKICVTFIQLLIKMGRTIEK